MTSTFQPSPQQQAVFDFVRNGQGHGLVTARAGSGKCLAPDTPVLRYDGRIVAAQAVVVGDQLMGPDSTPRTVHALGRGYGPLFRVRPYKGESWVCNDEHVLTLTGTSQKSGQTIDIPLRTHLDECQRAGRAVDRFWKLFRVGVEFKPVSIGRDPYEAGLEFAEINPTVYAQAPQHTRHIPERYLVNSRQVRLQVLAGVLDACAQYEDNSVVFVLTSRSEEFAHNVTFLARSLGFAVAQKRHVGPSIAYKFDERYYKLYICGDLDQIPTREPNKQARPRRQIKRVNVTGFQLESIGDGEYVGFTLDGDGRFLLGDFTVTHNTTTIVHAVNTLPPSTTVLCTAFNTRIRDTLRARLPQRVHVRTLHQLGRDTLRAFSDFRRFEHDESGKKLANIVDKVLAATRYNEAVKEAQPGAEATAAKATYAEVKTAVMRAATFAKAGLLKSRPELLALIAECSLKPTSIEDPNEFAEYVAQTVRLCLGAWPLTDFDDEIWMPVHFGLAMRAYDFVFVDEFQDLTLAQFQLVLSAARLDGRVLAIGDDAQAIYRWRGADRDVFDRFKSELDATGLSLSVSYRCPQRVIELVQAQVPDIQPHASAPEGLVANILESDLLELARPGDFVLSRTNAPLAQLGLKLTQRGHHVRILGASDVGAAITTLVRKSRKRTMTAFKDWLAAHVPEETEKLKDQPLALEYFEDRVAILRAFIDNAPEVTTTAALNANIDSFYRERRDAKPAIILSTVHKLKGEEAARVFVLKQTFFLKRGDAQEEANLWYVACTRAKSELYLVAKPKQSKEKQL